ncbi:MAG TPA: hypothetical protein VK644_00535 [Chitinophagaceae bacterium]|nr:hypothetical protein [Chitinophagaceae bacterium]
MKPRFKIFLLLFILLDGLAAFAQQTRFSLATDFSVQRSLRKDQKYWAIGQTVAAHFHLTPTDGVYAWLCYYTNGKFKNDLVGTAKSAIVTPQQVDFINRAKLSFKQISFGWKHYFIGASDAEENLNVYGMAGLGLLLGRIENTHSAILDTSSYLLPVLPGKANFKRLTFDVGLGIEKPVGGDVFMYLEGKVFIPSSGYPSNYLFVNKDAPLAALLNLGFRILF